MGRQHDYADASSRKGLWMTVTTLPLPALLLAKAQAAALASKVSASIWARGAEQQRWLYCHELAVTS